MQAILNQPKDYIRGKIAYLHKCRTKVTDDLFYALDVFEHLDVELDADNEDDDYSVLDHDDYNSDYISDSDCDEEQIIYPIIKDFNNYGYMQGAAVIDQFLYKTLIYMYLK